LLHPILLLSFLSQLLIGVDVVVLLLSRDRSSVCRIAPAIE
jgi:hypothetical protein